MIDFYLSKYKEINIKTSIDINMILDNLLMDFEENFKTKFLNKVGNYHIEGSLLRSQIQLG